MDSQASDMDNIGYTLSTLVKRKQLITRDQNPDSFWADLDQIALIAKSKATNPKWGPKKIMQMLVGQLRMTERMVIKYLAVFFFRH